MSGIHIFSGMIAFAIFIYLLVALFWPEKF